MNTFPLTTVESGGQIKEDARAEMARLWGERTQFTRSELGDAPQWARWVDKDGWLFDATDAFDAPAHLGCGGANLPPYGALGAG